MKILLILMAVVAGLVVSALTVRAALRWRIANQIHEPIEYYLGWTGYRHPIVLEHKLTKAEAEALHAAGTVYLIAHYDPTGKKILRIVKMMRGAVFFEFVYAYYPNGRLQSAKVTNSAGQVTVMAYDERGRRLQP